jgi:hypothetical protein
MSVPRVSLRWLMGSVTFLAIGCGLLVYARPITAYIVFAATLLVLFAAIPLSVYRSSSRRAFWFGFALFGLGYLGLVCGPWQAPDGNFQVGLRDRLPSTKLLEFVYRHLPTNTVGSPTGSGAGGGFFGQMGGMTAMGMGSPPITDWTSFATVGHSLWAIFIAVGGGVFTAWCQRTAPRERS